MIPFRFVQLCSGLFRFVHAKFFSWKNPFSLAPSRLGAVALKLGLLNPVNRVNPLKKRKKAPPFKHSQPKPSAIQTFWARNLKNPRHSNISRAKFLTALNFHRCGHSRSSLCARCPHCSFCHVFMPATNPALADNAAHNHHIVCSFRPSFVICTFVICHSP